MLKKVGRKMAKTTYDELEVKIVAKTDVAIGNIDRFSSRLEKLEQLANKLDFSKLNQIQVAYYIHLQIHFP